MPREIRPVSVDVQRQKRMRCCKVIQSVPGPRCYRPVNFGRQSRHAVERLYILCPFCPGSRTPAARTKKNQTMSVNVLVRYKTREDRHSPLTAPNHVLVGTARLAFLENPGDFASVLGLEFLHPRKSPVLEVNWWTRGSRKSLAAGAWKRHEGQCPGNDRQKLHLVTLY